MKIKKYEVSDMKEALRLIKQDLGPDAVILSTRKVMKNNNFGLFAKPVLEVTAAIDYTPPKEPQSSRTPSYSPQQKHDDGPYSAYSQEYTAKNRQTYKPRQDVRAAQVKEEPPAQKPRYGYDSYRSRPMDDEEAEYMELVSSVNKSRNTKTEAEDFVKYIPRQEEPDNSVEKVAQVLSSMGLDKLPELISDIGDIKKQLSEIKGNMSDNAVIDLPAKFKDLHSLFIKNGVDDVISYRFFKTLEKRVAPNLTGVQIKNAAMDMLSELILAEPDYSAVMSGRIIALAGPTGVGKTTTVAKIAANLVLKYGKRVCLITVDNFRIGAVEQLKTYAEIVNIPLYVASSPDELRRIIREVKNRYDCILIDSMGRSQFDTGQIKNMAEFFKTDENISVALVMSLASNHLELYDTLERYSCLRPEYLVFTKLDETRYFGPLINIPIKKRIPLLLITTGQNVPDDMEVPNGKKIAKRVLQEIPTLWSDK